jgi:hypothetical protein
LFNENEPGAYLYLLVEGEVEVLYTIGENGLSRVDQMGAGDIVGCSALVPPYNYTSITRSLTKIDVLSGIDPLMVCTEYRIPQEEAELHGLGTTLRYFPSHLNLLSKAIPVYIKVQGWKDLTAEDWIASGKRGKFQRRYWNIYE